MIENHFKRFDVFTATVPGVSADHFLILDGENGLKKSPALISVPLFLEKDPHFQLYIDCPINGTVYLAAIDGICPIDRSLMHADTAVGALTDEHARSNIEQTFKLLLNM